MFFTGKMLQMILMQNRTLCFILIVMNDILTACSDSVETTRVPVSQLWWLLVFEQIIFDNMCIIRNRKITLSRKYIRYFNCLYYNIIVKVHVLDGKLYMLSK